MMIFFNIISIVIGFALLIKGAGFLVDGASSLAKRFNVSNIAIGLTVVAMGTSAPELVVNAMCGVIITEEGTHDVVFGNIIGSNIFNVLLVLGITTFIHAPLGYNVQLNLDLYICMGGTLLLFFFMYSFGKYKLYRIEDVFYLLGFLGYFIFILFRQ